MPDLLLGMSVLEAGLWALRMLEVVVALGLVIFVHELGHFTVAKLCGVKCEKFYLGFDVNGMKLWHRQWGETEYGIGIVPLGGYVKMLGQDDNPVRAAEERERARRSPRRAPREPTVRPRARRRSALPLPTRCALRPRRRRSIRPW